MQMIALIILNAAVISMVHMHVSNKVTMQSSACSYNKNMFIIVQALLDLNLGNSGSSELGFCAKTITTF